MSVADKGQDSGESQPCMLFRDGRRDDREQKDLVCTTETSHRPSAALEKAATTERKRSVVAGLSGGRAVVLHHQISKMPDSARPSDLLRIWLPPPRFNSPQNTASPRKTRTTESWTKISDRQVKTAGELSLNDSWSIEQKLAVDLIDAVSLDLDILLPPQPKLASSLKKSSPPSKNSGTNTLKTTRDGGLVILQASRVSQRGQPTYFSTLLRTLGVTFRPLSPPSPANRNRLQTGPIFPAGLRFRSALSADFVQRPWWILANKVRCIIDVIKARSSSTKHTDGIYTFFGDAPHPNKRQIDVFLLFLAVVLRGAYDKGNSPWVKTLFAKLCALSFTPPSTENTPSPFTPTGEDPDDDNVSSDNSDDHDYTPSASNRTSASTTLLWGPHQLTGRWYGDLGDPDDYGVRLLHLLASGPQNSVYAGELFQKDKYIAAGRNQGI
ncbi:hypothetical protein B0H14DRAFT_2599189 [Mycena olivaceomarginata]|nr:hypothetical protein B0H14DRAFT_2599189 [Mycena olivaceomarginata]